MIINGKHSQIARLKCFVFSPHFDLGERNATFHLVYTCDAEHVKVTSPISNIHHVEDQVYIETKNSLYQLIIPDRCFIIDIPHTNIDAVEEYLKNPNFSSREFFHKHIPNKLPTMMGWEF